MSFKYRWSKQEANFGRPIEMEVSGGTHVSFENILRYSDKYVALRRPEAVPEHEIPEKALKLGTPHLYNVHGLPRWGETLDQYIRRIVKEQAGIGVKAFKVVDLTMGLYSETQQWFIEPTTIVEIDQMPIPGIYGNEVTEIVTFNEENIPDDFGWYSKATLEEFFNALSLNKSY